MKPIPNNFNRRRSLNMHTSVQQLLSLDAGTTNPKPSENNRHQEQHPVKPSSLTQGELISLIKSSSGETQLTQIHAHLLRCSLLHHHNLSLQLLSRALSSSFTGLRYSRRIFDQILRPSPSHYNAMIRAYSSSDSPDQGLQLYREMRQRGVRADPLSSSFAVKSCVKLRWLSGGLQLHGRILRDGQQSDRLLLTTLMDFYSNCERPVEACKVFEEMPQRDTVSWNVLISCCLRNGRTRDVLALFDRMKAEGFGCQPDSVTCLLALQACANLGALEFGEKVHRYATENGHGGAPKLSNSLITMYSRSGGMDKAYEVFLGMGEKNVVSWTSIISGFAMNGYEREAVDAFQDMERMGVLPDEQTFTAVLSACSHARMVDEGMCLFRRMSEEFDFVPNIHHYGCMVDLLGRAGWLDQAYQLIMSMSVKPDATIWRTLLGACRIHSHFALGEQAIERLVELKAEEASDYLLLLNIYSSAGNWDKVKELRKFMEEEGIRTIPGSSTVELKGTVHEFAPSDVTHPQKDDVYKVLNEIIEQLTIAGYVLDISPEMHDLGAEATEHAVVHHSEKLAIAFRLLSTLPGTTIRVSSSSRLCTDCHNFAKILSGVYNRKVVIRDPARFHHFREGRCSCNDSR